METEEIMHIMQAKTTAVDTLASTLKAAHHDGRVTTAEEAIQFVSDWAAGIHSITDEFVL
jgi:hypothetical protein